MLFFSFLVGAADAQYWDYQNHGTTFKYKVALFNLLEQAGVCDAGAKGSVEVSSSVFPHGRFRTTFGFHLPSVTVHKSDKDHFVRLGDSVGRNFVPYIYELCHV
ncbi:hypothetical protein BD769DRAFT_1542568 [Suillus cothurnatus]|nr:hypothetical protein BD769DRAFT_1542568 [Suillus cothurnatus]